MEKNLKRTEKSAVEIEILELRNKLLGIIAMTTMKVRDAQEAVELVEKAGMKCQELRKFRDNGTHRNKLLLQEIKELKARLKK